MNLNNLFQCLSIAGILVICIHDLSCAPIFDLFDFNPFISEFQQNPEGLSSSSGIKGIEFENLENSKDFKDRIALKGATSDDLTLVS